MNIVAFDLSLRATGFAHQLGTGTICPPEDTIYASGVKRLQWIRARVFDLVDPERGVMRGDPPDLVVVEGPSYSSQISHAHALGGLLWVIQVALADVEIPVVEVSPKSLKLFATGNGNAGKPDMLGAAIRQLNYPGNDNDQIDALWLFTMASTYYTGTAKNDAQRRALAGVRWPTVKK